MSTGGAGANFNLPDLVDVFVRGQSTQTAATGGANSKTLAIGEIPSHTHSASVTDPGHSHGAGTTSVGGIYFARWGQNPTTDTESATTGISVVNANTGGGGSFDNQPAFLEMQYIIKT